MRKKKFDAEKVTYAVLAIAFFFIFWWAITTFTPAKETTPGPIEVIKLLFESFVNPIGNYVITGHLLVSRIFRGNASWYYPWYCHGNFPLGGSDI